MSLKEIILEKCNERIESAKEAEWPQCVKEHVVKKGKASKEILEIVCGMQGITVNTAIQILNESKEIIKEVAMGQEI